MVIVPLIFIHRWETATPQNILSKPQVSYCTKSTFFSTELWLNRRNRATCIMYNRLNQMDEYFLFTGVEHTNTFIKKFNGWKRGQIWHTGECEDTQGSSQEQTISCWAPSAHWECWIWQNQRLLEAIAPKILLKIIWSLVLSNSNEVSDRRAECPTYGTSNYHGKQKI